MSIDAKLVLDVLTIICACCGVVGLALAVHILTSLGIDLWKER